MIYCVETVVLKFTCFNVRANVDNLTESRSMESIKLIENVVLEEIISLRVRAFCGVDDKW